MQDNLARVADEDSPSAIDELIASLEAGPVPVPKKPPPVEELPDEVTEPYVEVLRIERATKQRGGMPKFFKHEVEAIREDKRIIAEIAQEWGCSFDTIMRVRQQGRFKDVPYVARDDIEMVEGVEHRTVVQNYRAPRVKKGRPFKSGRREPVTAKEMADIAQDARASFEVAEDYNVSRAYVNKVRREMGTTLYHRAPLTEGIIAEIAADGRSYNELALAYRIPLALVRWIKGVT